MGVGRPPKWVDSKVISVSGPGSLLDQLDSWAGEHNVSRSEFIVNALVSMDLSQVKLLTSQIDSLKKLLRENKEKMSEIGKGFEEMGLSMFYSKKVDFQDPLFTEFRKQDIWMNTVSDITAAKKKNNFPLILTELDIGTVDMLFERYQAFLDTKKYVVKSKARVKEIVKQTFQNEIIAEAGK